MSDAALRDEIQRISSCYSWERIFGAYGFGDWVPDALLRLTEESKAIRNSVYDWIFEETNHQKTHYALTGPLSVTLVRLCAIPELSNRETLMKLLVEILDLRDDHVPRVLRKNPSGGLLWQYFYELTWHEMANAYDLLISMAGKETGVLAWGPARILHLAKSRVPAYPLDKPTPRPDLTNRQQLLDSVLAKPIEFTGYFDEADWGLDDVEIPLTVFGEVIRKAERNDYTFEDQEKWLQHCGVDASFAAQIPKMLDEDFANFDRLLSTNYGWEKDSAFVGVLITVLEQTIADIRENGSRCLRSENIAACILNQLGRAESRQEHVSDVCFQIAQTQPPPSFIKDAIAALVKLRQGPDLKETSLDKLFKLGDRNVTVIALESFSDVQLASHELALVAPFLSDEDWRIRRAALEALLNRDFELDAQTKSKIYKLYSDPDDEVRHAAVCVSTKPGAEYREQMLRCLSDPNEWIRASALRRIHTN